MLHFAMLGKPDDAGWDPVLGSCAHFSRGIIVEIYAPAESQSFFLVLPNNLPETFRGAQTCRSVVVRVGDAGMGMVQKRAGEIGVLAAARGDGGGARGAEHMRAHLHTHGCERGPSNHTRHLLVAYARAVV